MVIDNMTAELLANDTLLSDYVYTNDSINSSNLSSDSPLEVIDFESVEIYAVCMPFLLAAVVNVAIAVSIVRNANRNHLTVRRGDKYPVIDLILLILSITTTIKLLIRSGLQILCFSGKSLRNTNNRFTDNVTIYHDHCSIKPTNSYNKSMLCLTADLSR